MELKSVPLTWFLLLAISFTYGRTIADREDDCHTDNKEDDDKDTFDIIVAANMNESGLYHGDEVLTQAQRTALEEPSDDLANDLIRFSTKLWKDSYNKGTEGGIRTAIIHYTLASSLNTQGKTAIEAAIAAYNTHTCIRFVPRTTQRNYIEIFKGGGCWSYVGRTGGKQQISIGRGCEYKGTVIHEMMHALGYWHEQSRRDRDDYIRIKFENIQTGMASQFSKQLLSLNQSTEYDLDSIMHYSAKAFSKNGKETIVPIDTSKTLSRKNDLSKIDKHSLNLAYCPDYTSTGTTVTPVTTTTATTTTRPVTTTNPPSPNLPQAVCTWALGRGLCMYCYITAGCSDCGCTDCKDKNRYCRYWANKKDYCTVGRYTVWMQENCRVSCRGKCID